LDVINDLINDLTSTNSNTISSSFSLLHVVASVRSVFVVALIEILIVWSVAIEIAILKWNKWKVFQESTLPAVI
jgi:hypothetical protein